MNRTSADGTGIVFERAGNGPPLILVDGALCHRGVGPNAVLVEPLSQDFTVITYDRRGRGGSGDTAPYAVARELEDLQALIEAAGGSAYLYGISSGGALALEAAGQFPDQVAKLAVWEIPFVVDDSRPPTAGDFADHLQQLIAMDDPGAAVKLFMREAVQLPSLLVTMMPTLRGWAHNKALARTLLYDVAIMGDTQRGNPLPADRWTAVTMPTLVASGGKSPVWVGRAAAQLAQILPNAQPVVLAGQRHYVKAAALAPVLRDFFADAATRPAADERGRKQPGHR